MTEFLHGKLRERLHRARPLILSGAMGTELERRGVNIGLPLWSANGLIDHPEIVRQIHEDYIAAGADIIVTNTFRTNTRAFANASVADRSPDLTATACTIAHEARDRFTGRDVLIAGCVAPAEDCYKPELVPSERQLLDEHGELIERLVKGGVDFILIETMTTIREAYAASAAASAAGKEFIVSFTCLPDGRLIGGDSLSDAVETIAKLHPVMFSLNCISPRYLTPLIHQLTTAVANVQARVGDSSPPTFAVYGNIGKPDVRDGVFVRDIDARVYAHHAAEWFRLGASIIGGCCGTTPEYIKELRNTFR